MPSPWAIYKYALIGSFVISMYPYLSAGGEVVGGVCSATSDGGTSRDGHYTSVITSSVTSR